MSEKQINQRHKLIANHEAGVKAVGEAKKVALKASTEIEAFDLKHPEICAAFNRVEAQKRADAKPKPEPIEAEVEGET